MSQTAVPRVSDSLLAALQGEPERVAVIDQHGSTAYRALADRAGRVHDLLIGMVGRRLHGEVVAVPVENTASFVGDMLGIMAAGGTHLPIRIEDDSARERLRDRAGRWHLLTESSELAKTARSWTDGVIINPASDEQGSAGLVVEEDGAASGQPSGRILETSGTSGPPKWVHWHEFTLLADRLEWVKVLGLGPGDVALSIHPLDVAHAVDVHVLPMLLCGGTVVIAPMGASVADAVDLVLAHGVTYMSALPAQLDAMADVAALRGIEGVDSMRLVLTGGAPLTQTTVTNVREKLGWRLRRLYGATECGIMCADLSDRDQDEPALRPLEGVVVELRPIDHLPKDGTGLIPSGSLDVGEAWIRREHSALGYWGEPLRTAAAFPADGWYRTGDALRRVAPDTYAVLGRTTDVWMDNHRVLSGPEVAAAIQVLQGVREVVVFRPQDDCGSDVFAVLEPDASVGVLEEQIQGVLSRLALSGRVWLANAWPRTVVGKPERRGLEAWARIPHKG